jgi:hypothetical protein
MVRMGEYLVSKSLQDVTASQQPLRRPASAVQLLLMELLQEPPLLPERKLRRLLAPSSPAMCSAQVQAQRLQPAPLSSQVRQVASARQPAPRQSRAMEPRPRPMFLIPLVRAEDHLRQAQRKVLPMASGARSCPAQHAPRRPGLA